jgi:hypothetical protein
MSGTHRVDDTREQIRRRQAPGGVVNQHDAVVAPTEMCVVVRGQLQEQLQKMQSEAVAHPTNFQNILNLASLYTQIQETNRAAELLRQAAVLLGPALADTNAQVGNVTAMAQICAMTGDYAKLETALQKLVTLVPDAIDALLKLNVSYCPIRGGQPDCGTGVTCGEADTAACVPGCFDPASEPDADADGVPDRCDNCVNIANPREAAGCFSTPTVSCGAWSTLTGGQRDDDHDGYGNKCDAKFPGVAGAVVSAGDLTQFRTALGKSVAGDNCGTVGTHPCAIYDLDETGLINSTGDLRQFRPLNGGPPGPKCPSCPLYCQAGTDGTCGPIP